MKSNTRNKILALLAAGSVAFAGAAWGIISKGSFTPDATAANFTDNNRDETGTALTSSVWGFQLASSGAQTGGVTLPSALSLRSGTNPSTTAASVTNNAGGPVGLSYATKFWVTPGGPGFNTLGVPAAADLNTIDTSDIGDNGGVIFLNADQELTLRPGAGSAIVDPTYALGFNSLTEDPDTANAAAETAGMLRLSGGTTTIYGANNNNPNDATRNTFNGGTFLMAGNLRVAHSNAFGEGHVMLNQGTHMTVFDNDTSLGYKAYDAAQTGLGTTQYLWLRRDPRTNASDPALGASGEAALAARRTRSNIQITADTVGFTVYSGIREYLTNNGLASDGTDEAFPGQPAIWLQHGEAVYGAGLLKDGSGPMTIQSDLLGGAWHTRGTRVAEGSLNVNSSGTAIYAASLGRAWPEQADILEEESALTNYNAAVGAALAVPYKNYLVIDEGASVTLNRDQFFGHFSGAGNFTVNSWNFQGGKKIPQIVIQTDASSLDENNYSDTDFGAESTFSGRAAGTFDLVLDAGYLANGTAGEIFPVDSANAWRKVLRFTGENNSITEGDTTIVGGILSAKTVGNLPPGNIYVGSNPTRNGYKTAALTSEFVSGTTPTLHAYGSFTTAEGQLVTVSTPQMINEPLSPRGAANYIGFPEGSAHAGLAADRGSVMTLPNVEVYNGFMVNEEMRVGDNVTNAPRGWEGEVRFSDRYTFPNSTLAAPTNIVIDRGVLHLEKMMEKGFAKVQINTTGVLSLGNEARDFTSISDKGMDVVFGAPGQSDQRIRLIVKPEDLKTSKAEARAADAIFNAGAIDYVGLGMGEANRNRRIVIQLDLSQVGNTLPAGTWIKAIYSPQAYNWENLEFLREGSGTDDEDYAKVRVAYTNNATIDGNKVTGRLDQNMGTIFIYVSETVTDGTDTPTPSLPVDNDMITAGTGNPTTLAQGAAVSISGSIDPAAYDVDSLAIVTNPSTAGWTINWIDKTAGTFTVTGTMPNSAVSYYFTAQSLADNTTYKSPSTNVALSGDGPISSSGSSGCDAGFGAFALLAAAGSMIVLRRKD